MDFDLKKYGYLIIGVVLFVGLIFSGVVSAMTIDDLQNEIDMGNDVFLTDEITINHDMLNDPVILDLKGHTVTAAEGKRHFVVNRGELRLVDSVGGGKLDGNNVGGGVKVVGDMAWTSTFNMQSGMITHCVAASGGAVECIVNGCFIMFNGTIADCRATYNGELAGGGALYLYTGSGNMFGGEIIGCSGNYGGAVYVGQDSRFAMYNGTISHCYANEDGGVYCAEKGTWTVGGRYPSAGIFEQTGGSIIDCGKMPAIVDSGTCGDNLTWVLTDDGILTISGTGDMYDYSYTSSTTEPPWEQYRYQMNSLVLENELTSIGDHAFDYYDFTGTLTIPSSVTRIGNFSFAQCKFTGSLVIPDNVTIIGDNAFVHNDGFTNVFIPSSVLLIENCAFGGCSNLTEICVDSNNKKYSSDAEGILYNKNKTALIWCPDGKTGSIIIPSSVTTIEHHAFSDCRNITNITLPSSVTTIEALAFYGCSGLTNVFIPSSVTTIEDNSGIFILCSNLNEITVDVNNPNYSSDAQGILYDKNKYRLIECPCGKTGYVSIPSSVISIGDEAFYYCSRLTNITIPSSVISIGYMAYFECSGISNLSIPSSVIFIGHYAFSGCSGLTDTLTIPNSVTTIGISAFSRCHGLTSVSIPSSVTTIEMWAFNNCNGLTEIRVDPNNQYYSSDSEGILYNKNKSILICCPGGKEDSVIVPSTVTTIGNDAFHCCGNLLSVSIPSSVTSTGQIILEMLHQNSVIYAECNKSLLINKYSLGRSILATLETKNAYSFTVDQSSFPSGFPLTEENAPTKVNMSFAGWYTNPSYIGEKVRTVSDGQTLYAKWISDDLKLYPGWNVISVPKQLTSAYDTAAELFADVDTEGHAILTYNASTKSWEQITASTKITPLNAYWIYSNEGRNLPYEFSSSVSSPAVKNVYKGWNAVGLSADEPLSASLTFGNTNWYTYLEWNASTQGFKKPIIKGGTGEYADTNLVSLWTGGWLFLNEDGTYMGFTA